jgi:L-iditol 2-dehydrogenase
LKYTPIFNQEKKMNALVKTKQTLELRTSRRPTLGPRQVLIQVKSVGLCRTDLLVADGSIQVEGDLVLGHEFSGVVVETTSDLFQIDQRVSVNPYDENLGFMGLDRQGALCDFVAVNEGKVIAAPGLDFKTAAYLEPVAASMAVLSVCTNKRKRGAVYGKNRIAELTYLILKSEGLRVDWLDEKAIPKSNAYDYVVETLFSEEAVRDITQMLKPGGLLVIKSRKKQAAGVVAADWVSKELTLKCVNYSSFEVAMRWLTVNQEKVQHLLGKSYPIQKWEEAFAEARRAEGKKTFIHFN